MKKAFKTIIALIVAVLLTVGCAMKTTTGFVISKDGDVTVKLIMAMDKEMIDTYLTISEDPSLQQSVMGEDFKPENFKAKEHTDEQRWAFFDSDDMKSSFDDYEGFTKEKYTEGDYMGYVFSRDLGKLDAISTTSATERVSIGSSDSDFSSIFVKDGDVYKSNMKIGGETELDSETVGQITQLGGIIDISLDITLPVKPTSSNADKTSADGKTLTWDLTKQKDVELEFDLSKASAAEETDPKKEEEKKEDKKDSKKDKDSDDEKSNLILYIGIGAGALILLVVIVAIVLGSKKKKAAQPETIQPAVMTPSFEQPAAPVAQPVPAEPAVAPVQPVAQPVQQPVEQPVDPNQPQQ